MPTHLNVRVVSVSLISGDLQSSKFIVRYILFVLWAHAIGGGVLKKKTFRMMIKHKQNIAYTINNGLASLNFSFTHEKSNFWALVKKNINKINKTYQIIEHIVVWLGARTAPELFT